LSFDIRICFEFRISIFGFSLNTTFRSGTIYDDPHAFSVTDQDCYFIYGQTFSGRYLLVLVRILSSEEVNKLGLGPGTNVLKIITARDMNKKQRKIYNKRKGSK